MYRRIVERKVRQTFERINAGDWMVMVDSLAPEFEYVFHGDHALGGRRTTRHSMIRWWTRVTALLPGVEFQVRDVIVSGGPAHTRVAVRAVVSGDLPDGGTYRNTMFQFMTLSRGKVTTVETIEDLQVLDRALAVVARYGQPDAAAEPITD